MKCIRCNKDCTYPQRSARKCPGCQGEFAFEPRTGDVISDAGFQSAIEAVSSKGSVRWGIEHLYYEVGRRIFKAKLKARRNGVVALSVALCIGGIVSVISADLTRHGIQWLILFFVLAIFVFGGFMVFFQTGAAGNETIPLAADAFDRMWTRWLNVHARPTGFIARLLQPAKPVSFDADLSDYSFDRAVICDRARTVDLLLANNFHFENNCAILSIDGYPAGPFKTVREMLKKNPRLEVFALHDATEAGCRLASQLATDPEWFAGRAKVVDVGLRPVHAKRSNGQLQPAYIHVEAEPGIISHDEARWLSQYKLELASIRPEQVLKRLFRAINNKSGDTSVSDGGSSTGTSIDSDAGASDAGSDSFG